MTILGPTLNPTVCSHQHPIFFSFNHSFLGKQTKRKKQSNLGTEERANAQCGQRDRKALRPEEIPSRTAVSHLVNSLEGKSRTQNWSLINYAVEDLLLVGSKAEKPWPAQRGDSESCQQAQCIGYCAVNLCLTAYGHPAQRCSAGKLPFDACHWLYFIYLHF